MASSSRASSSTAPPRRKGEVPVHRCGGLPNYIVGLEEPLHRLREALKENAVVGVVGEAGIGKTTIAKQLFNCTSMEFEYTCFVENVKHIPIHALEYQLLNQFHCNGTKVNANGINWSHMQEKKTLVFLDGVDTLDQLTVLPELHHFGVGSRLVVTSMDKRAVLSFLEDAFIFSVAHLSFDDAEKLFYHNAFGPGSIHRPRNPLVINLVNTLVNTIVNTWKGLPLSLEVVGCNLRGHENDVAFWEETTDKLVTGFPRNMSYSRELHVLALTIDALAEKEKEMFIEAGTFFLDQPLEEALAAWSTVCESPRVCWSNLLSRSIVKEVWTSTWNSSCNREITCMKVSMHDVLRRLAEIMLVRKVVAPNSGIKFIEYDSVVRVNTKWVRAYSDREDLMIFQSDYLPFESEEFKYVDLDGFVLQLRENFSSKRSLLKWKGRCRSTLPQIIWDEMEDLAILELEDWEVPNKLLGSVGNLRNLQFLSLHRLAGLDRLPDNFGRLSKLRRLELVGLRLLNLPVSFGNLSALEHLTIVDVGIVELPTSFGGLSSLITLTIRSCLKLSSLPSTFGHLSCLKELYIQNCPLLLSLPKDFGQLRALKTLSIEQVKQLGSLPETFGNLVVLTNLTLNCKSLKLLPQSFGTLPSLKDLTLDCESLELLPTSFVELSSLRHLTINSKRMRQLPPSFGALFSLKHLTLCCLSLLELPGSFGVLPSLKELSLQGCPNLERVPNLSFSEFRCFMSLRRLTILRFDLLGSLSDCIRIFESLEELSVVNPISDAAAQAIVQAYFVNEAFTAILKIDWSNVSDLSLERKFYLQRQRNFKLRTVKEKVWFRKTSWIESCSDSGSDVEESEPNDIRPLTSAKIFLCGYPEVGKTRLRKTLKKSIGYLTRFKWETGPKLFNEPHTRGIEVNRLQEKTAKEGSTSLVLWDLAGQAEFHVLHGTFFPDLGFAHGKATTFVLVFKATFEDDLVQEKFLYWLRFVASSCQKAFKDGKRHVAIVLNRFGGKQCEDSDRNRWTFWIEKYESLFQDWLSIHKVPFIIDVRVAASVKPLKDYLFKHVRDLLEGEKVPRLCFDLQLKLKEKWPHNKKNIHYPILTWQAFQTALDFNRKRTSQDALKAAATYLHETTGDLVYFNDPESSERSVVVPNPTWFCKEIVGQLLLPKQMATGKEKRVKVNFDGSININNFMACFKHKLHEGIEGDHVILMLEKLGLCFRRGEEKIIIPALIESQDDYRSMGWEGKGSNIVMGRSLVVEDKERTALPVTVFRKLQVDLAKDENFGGRTDCESKAGKSFSIFKVGRHLVLIQFDEDGGDPRDDRIDILVKELREGEDSTITSLGQVKRISEIMTRLEKLCVVCCPGVTYDIMVIEPWRATQDTPKMIDRKLMSLKDIKKLVRKGEEYISWQLQLKLKIFLSDRELEGVVDTAERDFNNCKKSVVTLGLLTEDSLARFEAYAGESSTRSHSDVQSMSMESEAFGDDRVSNQRLLQEIQDVKRVLRQEGRLTRQHFDARITDLFDKIREKHEDLVKQLQAQQAFSIDEKASSVPRFMFLTRKEEGLWIKLKDALGQTTFHLHLLCEAEWEKGLLHEVVGQKGLEITQSKKWLEKISPWMRWSLKVAVMAAKTAGNIYLPGVFTFIPEFNYLLSDPQNLAKAVDSAALLLEEDNVVSQGQASHENLGSAEQPRNLKKERMIAQEVVNDLISELPGGHIEFAKKIGLRKVLLRARVQPQVGSSREADSVVWICDNCYTNYGDSATDISPRR